MNEGKFVLPNIGINPRRAEIGAVCARKDGPVVAQLASDMTRYRFGRGMVFA